MAALARRHLVEDITDVYPVHVSSRVIDTSRPGRAVRPGPGAAPSAAVIPGAKPPGPGKRHCLVDLKGPIKDAWLRAVKRAGDEPRVAYQHVVRAGEPSLARISAPPRRSGA